MKEIFKKNRYFVGKYEQDKMRNECIFAAGCGLSSQIIILAARTGFEKFILADGDVVEESNLNRQVFDIYDIGKNKSEALANKILGINKSADIKVIPRFLEKKEEFENIIDASDVVLNTVNADKAIYIISKACRNYRKTEVFPLNLGFGSFFLYFSKDEIIPLSKLTENEVGVTAYRNIIMNTIGIEEVAEYFLEIILKYNLLEEDAFPQLGVATYLNAALILNAIMRELKGDEVNTINYLDPRNKE